MKRTNVLSLGAFVLANAVGYPVYAGEAAPPKPLWQRYVDFDKHDRLMLSEEARLEEFLTEPKELFVFANADLERARVRERIWTTSMETSDTEADKLPKEHLRKDEPLLRIGTEEVLSADGLVWEVREDLLAEAPSGPIS